MKRLLIGVVLALAAMSAHATDVDTGTFSLGITGCDGAPSGSAEATYVKENGTGLTVLILPNLWCVSNSTDLYMTGLPTKLVPVLRLTAAANVRSGGNTIPGSITLIPGLTTLNFAAWNGVTITSTGFSAMGAKGLTQPGVTLTYFSAPAVSP